MAVAALVCGLVGLLLLQIILGPLAIIFGAVGIGTANKRNGAGHGMATAGLILGCIDIVVFFALVAALS